MSESEPTVTYEPVWLKHRANVVEAIRYDGTEHCRRAIRSWVNERVFLDERSFLERMAEVVWEDASGNLWIRTPQQKHKVVDGQWVVRGVTGEFYNPDDDVVTLNYDRVPGPDRGATLNRDQAAAIVVAADEIKDEVRERLREGALGDLGIREYVDSLVESVHQLATALEAER